MTVCLRQSVFVPPLLSVLAQELGCFADAGLDVETLTTTSSTHQLHQLTKGEADIGVSAIDNVFAWNAAGADLRVVAQVERTTALRLAAGPDHTSVAALRGGVIAVDAVDNGFALVLRHLLARHGLDGGEYALTPVGGVRERFDALMAGTVDATLLGPPFDELATRGGATILLSVERELPDFPGQGVIASSAILESEALAGYLAALDRARRWATEAGENRVRERLLTGGHPLALAAALARTCPASLVPPRGGLELLVTIRRELGLMPSGAPGVDDLYAQDPLGQVVCR